MDDFRGQRPPALYDSRRHGLKPFHRLYVTRAALPRSYVETHPNLAPLESTLRDMRALAARHGFRVTVVLAPSAERLYAPYYEKFPSVSPTPYFLDHVEAVARGLGLGVMNLYAPLRPRADRELLYYRDDTHWNERGQEVVAEVIAERIFQRPQLPTEAARGPITAVGLFGPAACGRLTRQIAMKAPLPSPQPSPPSLPLGAIPRRAAR